MVRYINLLKIRKGIANLDKYLKEIFLSVVYAANEKNLKNV